MALSLTSTKNKSFIKTEVVNQRVSVTKLVGSTKYWVNQPLQADSGILMKPGSECSEKPVLPGFSEENHA